MIRLAALLTLVPLTGGCVAAAIPIAASSTIVKQRMDERKADRRATPALPPAPVAAVQPAAGQRWTVVPGATALPPPSGAPASMAATPPGVVPPAMQYLYGSGEGAALSVQAYAGLTAYLRDKVAEARAGKPLRQVVLADGASLNAPYFDQCGSKPLAAVFDVDETAILNLGYEGDAAKRGETFDESRWERWEATGAEKVVAVPGVEAAIAQARAAGVVVIFNSNRTNTHAAATARALEHAGLGPVRHGTTLWLKGDDGGGSGKDDRRGAISAGYCVIALIGDQLGDFSDLFNAPGLSPSTRRALAASPALAPLWGNGWFVLPNPVYGSALKGGFDEIFPVDMRWSDPADGVK